MCAVLSGFNHFSAAFLREPHLPLQSICWLLTLSQLLEKKSQNLNGGGGGQVISWFLVKCCD